jgi:hypothetical protein
VNLSEVALPMRPASMFASGRIYPYVRTFVRKLAHLFPERCDVPADLPHSLNAFPHLHSFLDRTERRNSQPVSTLS